MAKVRFVFTVDLGVTTPNDEVDDFVDRLQDPLRAMEGGVLGMVTGLVHSLGYRDGTATLVSVVDVSVSAEAVER